MSSQKQTKRPPTIGIDLGTMYSCIGTWNRVTNKVDIIQRVPSSLSFFHSCTFIGLHSDDLMEMNPNHTLFDIKRLIGRNSDDENTQKEMKRWPFKLTKTAHSRLSIQITNSNNEKTIFNSEDILAMFLFYLKQIADRYIGESVSNVIISIPQFFNNTQRQSVKDSAKIAGLNVYRLASEPSPMD